jgi:mRNA interferase RelE/StbE
MVRPSWCARARCYRIRVGDYRVLYGVGDAVLIVTIVRIGHRRDMYEER